MDKKQFKYRDRDNGFIWTFVFMIPIIYTMVAVCPLLLKKLNSWTYISISQDITNIMLGILEGIIIMIMLSLIWRIVNVLPLVVKTGYFWKEEENVVIEYNKKKVVLDNITELYYENRDLIEHGVRLYIRN